MSSKGCQFRSDGFCESACTHDHDQKFVQERDRLLNIISLMADDLGHWGMPKGQRCRSQDSMVAILLDRNMPVSLRDTCCYALANIALDNLTIRGIMESVRNEPNNVGRLATKHLNDFRPTSIAREKALRELTRRFPVHSDLGQRPKSLPSSVPWELLAGHEAQALANHGQTLQRLAERGGLDPQEMWCCYHDKSLREIPGSEVAEAWLVEVNKDNAL